MRYLDGARPNHRALQKTLEVLPAPGRLLCCILAGLPHRYLVYNFTDR